MEEPDYDSYTLEELRDVEAHIDKAAYPQRYQRILDILNDPQKLEKLKEEQSLILENRTIENNKNVGVFGAVIYWIYGAIIAIAGIAYGRNGDKVYIDSIFIRIALSIVFLVAGYKYMMSKIQKK